MVQSFGTMYGFTPLNGYVNKNSNTQPKGLIYGFTPQNEQVSDIQNVAQEEAFVSERGNTCTDGKDDGKIGFAQGAGHYLKGATVNFLKGLVGFDQNGKWSFKRLLKNVALTAGAAALHIATGGISTAIIAGAGIFSTGTGIVKGAIKASKATTDAEAKDAWEDMGTNTTGLVLSVAGAKAAMKQINPTGNYSGFKGTLRAAKDANFKSWDLAKQAWNGAKTAYKDGGFSNVITKSGQFIKNSANTAQTSLINSVKNADGTAATSFMQGARNFGRNFVNPKSTAGTITSYDKINGSLVEAPTAIPYSEMANVVPEQLGSTQFVNGSLPTPGRMPTPTELASLDQYLKYYGGMGR